MPEAIEPSGKRVFPSPKMLGLKVSLSFQPRLVVTDVPVLRRNVSSTISLHPEHIRHRCVVPIAELDHATLQSLAYARSISPHVIAAHMTIDRQDILGMRSRWEQVRREEPFLDSGVQLVVIESPYRSLLRPLLAYIDAVQETHPAETVTVILPEFVVAHWWEQPLHNQTALRLKAALLKRPGIVVTDIPQHLRSRGGL